MPTRLERILTASLGSLWLIDGILQLQPAMFTNAFVQTILAPNLQSQPRVIVDIVAFGIRLWNINPSWSDTILAFIQIFIGLLLLSILVFPARENTRRFGLRLSVVWALVIWIFGEAFGNLFTGSATFYTGAPGSALLYAVIAIFLLYALRDKEQQKWLFKKLPTVAGIFFLLSALPNFMPVFWQPGTPTAIITNLLAIGALACLGILLIVLPNRPVAWITLLFLIAVWWLGQGFGGIQTFPFGTATDPNSAPLFALFLLPILMHRRSS